MNRSHWLTFLACAGLAVSLVACGGGGGAASTTGGGSDGGNTNGGNTDGGGPGPAGLAWIRGRVQIERFDTSGIPGVVVNFYNASGGLLASTTTNSSGNFSVDLPPQATFLHVPRSTIDGAVYYGNWLLGANSYSSSDIGCAAPLGTTQADNFNNTGSIRLILRGDPPPPPPSCL